MSGAFELRSVPVPGLGNRAHLLVSEGEAFLVDVPRVSGQVLAEVALTGARVRWVAETHVHNDYLSGALEVRKATGAEVVTPAEGAYRFARTGVHHGDEIEVGAVTVRALATPGHTPEHLAYVVHEDGEPAAVLTGGSLLVGDAGRTDLLGPDRAEELGRAQFRSLRLLAALGSDVVVAPTHGGGSFCSTVRAPDVEHSTIGTERGSNPLLLLADEDAFLAGRRLDRYPYPAYYAAMGPANLLGPTPAPPDVTPVQLSLGEVDAQLAGGAVVVDTRNEWAFAAGHVPRSYGVALSDSFAGYLGSVIPVGTTIVLLASDRSHAAEAAARLLRIGYEVAGSVAGGFEAWTADGRPVATTPILDFLEFPGELRGSDVTVLDVRSPWEWDQVRYPGAIEIHLGELPLRVDEIPRDREVWIVCASGRRAAVAGTVLERAGIQAGVILGGGVADVQAATV